MNEESSNGTAAAVPAEPPTEDGHVPGEQRSSRSRRIITDPQKQRGKPLGEYTDEDLALLAKLNGGHLFGPDTR